MEIDLPFLTFFRHFLSIHRRPRHHSTIWKGVWVDTNNIYNRISKHNYRDLSSREREETGERIEGILCGKGKSKRHIKYALGRDTTLHLHTYFNLTLIHLETRI